VYSTRIKSFVIQPYYSPSMPKSMRRGRRGAGRRSAPLKLGLPKAFKAKPIGSMTFGWQLALAAASSGSDAALAFAYDDIMWAIGILQTAVTAGNPTLLTPFCSVRVKSVEMWEFNGLPISLTWSQVGSAGVYVPGPDSTVSDTGSSAVPSHVKLVPSKNSLQSNWFSTNSSGNMVIATFNDKLGSSGTPNNQIRLLIRFHIDYVLNDASAFSNTYISGTSQTITGVGLMYWRCVTTSSNTWYPEAFPGVSTYIA